MNLKINKITDKLDLDVEAQWNCNSSTHCRVAQYTNTYDDVIHAVGGSAISICLVLFSGYVYTTSGWSIF